MDAIAVKALLSHPRIDIEELTNMYYLHDPVKPEALSQWVTSGHAQYGNNKLEHVPDYQVRADKILQLIQSFINNHHP